MTVVAAATCAGETWGRERWRGLCDRARWPPLGLKWLAQGDWPYFDNNQMRSHQGNLVSLRGLLGATAHGGCAHGDVTDDHVFRPQENVFSQISPGPPCAHKVATRKTVVNDWCRPSAWHDQIRQDACHARVACWRSLWSSEHQFAEHCEERGTPDPVQRRGDWRSVGVAQRLRRQWWSKRLLVQGWGAHGLPGFTESLSTMFATGTTQTMPLTMWSQSHNQWHFPKLPPKPKAQAHQVCQWKETYEI